MEQLDGANVVPPCITLSSPCEEEGDEGATSLSGHWPLGMIEEEEDNEDGEEENIDEEEEQEILAGRDDEEEEIEEDDECDAAFSKLPEREQTMFRDLHLAVLKEVRSNKIKPLTSILRQLGRMPPPEIQFCIESYDGACAARVSRVSGDGVPSLPVGADAGGSPLSELHMCNLSDTAANTETAGGHPGADAGGSTHNQADAGGSTYNHLELDERRECDAAAADGDWADYYYWTWHADRLPLWRNYQGPKHLLTHLDYHFGHLYKFSQDKRFGRESLSTKLWELRHHGTPPSMENPVFFSLFTFVLENVEALATCVTEEGPRPSYGAVAVQKILVLSAAEEKARMIQKCWTSAAHLINHPSGCFVASQIMEEACKEADSLRARPGDGRTRSVIEAAHDFMIRAHEAPDEQQYWDNLRRSMTHIHANHSMRLWVLGLKKDAALPHETRELDAMLYVVRTPPELAREMVMNCQAVRIVNELLRNEAESRLRPMWEALVQDPDDADPDPEDRLATLIDHPFANHTIQVFIEAPEARELVQHLICTVVGKNFVKYALHQHANYVVQKCFLIAGRYWLLQYAAAYIQNSDAIHEEALNNIPGTADPLPLWQRLSMMVRQLKNERVALEQGDEATPRKVAESLEIHKPPWFPKGRPVPDAMPKPKRYPRPYLNRTWTRWQQRPPLP